MLSGRIILLLVAGSYVGRADEDILTWEAPEEIQKNFPYYLAGENDEGSAIWILPFGAWITESRSSEDMDMISKHFDQALVRMSNSAKNASGFLALVDMEGFSFFDADLTFALDKCKAVYKKVSDSDLKHGWIINSSFFFDAFWKIAKHLTLSNDLTEKFETFDEEDHRWKETITNWIPKSKLPEKYGGSQDFVPDTNFG